ncbi:unnamed protein product [Schistosoma mattheei]|uniref:MAM domain-containing protein n=1 Tax=Schistosoma mattheei TaxID=31246 RepID=A0AA85BB42_9TREM|nr:unnamed protein product [Schistosoma mattheei]
MKIVCSILFLFALSVKAIDPVYFCPFTKNLCDWTNDPNSWQNHWSVIEEPNWHTTDNNGVSPTTSEESYCCLTSAVYSGSDSSNMAVRHSPWIIQPHLLNDLKDSTTKKAIHSRLWSASIPTKLGLKCMTFVYSIQFGSSSYHQDSNLFSDSTKEASLAVLQRSEGACIKHGTSQNRQTSVTCQNTELWSSESLSKIFEQWSTARVDLQEFASTLDSSYKLILEGTIPAGYPDARICVDNITSYTEPCSALEKASAPLPSQWSWAQYFGLTFVGALILGLLIPVLFLVILIWACRRRHHAMHSNYTNSKLFSTNLWYYIGGKEICDDPNGFRGSSSLLRSKQFNSPSATGTLLNGGGGHHLMLSNADVMDLPDVVVPGGRVVAFNYSGNTLGGNTLRHNHNNAGYTNTNYLSNAQNGQVMLTNVNGTVSLNNCGTNVTTVARTGQNAMPLVSNELIQQQSQSQQQNETYNYQTNPVFGESASMALMTASQSPMLMTQSMAPNYGSEANHIAQSNFSNANTQQINQLNSNGQVYNKPAVPPAQQQHQPRAQSQYFPRPNNLKRI